MDALNTELGARENLEGGEGGEDEGGDAGLGVAAGGHVDRDRVEEPEADERAGALGRRAAGLRAEDAEEERADEEVGRRKEELSARGVHELVRDEQQREERGVAVRRALRARAALCSALAQCGYCCGVEPRNMRSRREEKW